MKILLPGSLRVRANHIVLPTTSSMAIHTALHTKWRSWSLLVCPWDVPWRLPPRFHSTCRRRRGCCRNYICARGPLILLLYKTHRCQCRRAIEKLANASSGADHGSEAIDYDYCGIGRVLAAGTRREPTAAEPASLAYRSIVRAAIYRYIAGGSIFKYDMTSLQISQKRSIGRLHGPICLAHTVDLPPDNRLAV